MTEPEPARRPAPPGAPSEGGRQVIAWAFVAVQAVLILALVIVPGGEAWPRTGLLSWLGICAITAGAAVLVAAALRLGHGLTASPLPNAAAQLRTTGLYARVRHPIYSALLLITAGLVADSGSLIRLAIFAALLLLLTLKARWEEDRLSERFPGYRDYAARTPRFLPRPRLRSPSG